MAKVAWGVVALVGLVGCGIDVDDADMDPVEDGAGATFTDADGKADTGGVAEGTPEADAVLWIANEATSGTLRTEARLTQRVADNLVAYRLGDDGRAGTGDDERFDDLAELDRVPYVGPLVVEQLLDHARKRRYLDVPAGLAGIYDIESTIVLGASAPAAILQVVAELEDLADGGDDPATYFLDAFGSDALAAARPALDAAMNELLVDESEGQLLVKLDRLGADFRGAAQRLELSGKLVIEARPGGALVARHTVTGVTLRSGDRARSFSMGALGLADVTGGEQTVTSAGGGRFVLGAGKLPLPYAELLGFALDRVIVPELSASARTFRELFFVEIDCRAIGESLYAVLGLWSPAYYQATCDRALDAATEQLGAKVAGLASFRLELAGVASATDREGDRVIDELSGGVWNGQAVLGAAAGALSPSSFRATRTAR